MQRLAIVDPNKCKPSKCNGECKKSCPVVAGGKQCIVVSPTSNIALISEILCIGCNICTKRCPFGAIDIIKIPSSLSKEVVHNYGLNMFRLHRFPIVKPGQILGLIGSNGSGKTTALKILSGKLVPNLDLSKTDIEDIMKQNTVSTRSVDVINYFKGSELQTYFKKLYNDELRPVLKPQYVDNIPKTIKGRVRDFLKEDDLLTELDLLHLLDRDIEVLSGGELQRFAIARTLQTTICKQPMTSSVYLFDEPSSYLDIKQRVQMAKIIRSYSNSDNYIIVVEHDLSILDYLSDYICLLYGKASAYGVVTAPFNVRDGINIFLSGYIPTENMRFRDNPLDFKLSDESHISYKNDIAFEYEQQLLQHGQDKDSGFSLEIEAGIAHKSEIIILLGENGTGKTSFIKKMVENLKNKNKTCSYKPQKIAPTFTGTVEELLNKKISSSLYNATFKSEVLKPLDIENIMQNKVLDLSGGELQRVALALCLGLPADVYLIDEPSAYLDSEQRVIVSKMLKNFMTGHNKTAFIVEHDFMMALYLANKVIVYEGQVGLKCKANKPCSVDIGMNKFLEQLEITFRRDDISGRPRINKLNSVKDQEQKKSKMYWS